MPSDKLKSFFIRNNLIFPGSMKHNTSTNNTSPSTDTNRKTPPTVYVRQPETRMVTSQQGLEATATEFPNPASPSCPYTSPRVPSLPPLSTEHAHMASSRQIKKGKEKAANVNDDHRSHTHPLRRSPHGLSVNETADNDKSKVLAEKVNTSGPISSAEFERLKKEVELLKRTVIEQRKTMKKQSKKNEELKNEVATSFSALTEKDTELTAKDEELRKMKDKFGKIESTMSSIETIFQCQVCIELLHRPYVLSPCGHVFCLLCLQEWFRRAPAADYEVEEDLDNPRYILRRPKSCPCCRTKITHRPIPLFVLRSATNALASSRAQVLGTEYRSDSPVPDNDEDPWKGIFPSSEDNEDSNSDDEESSSESAGADSMAESDDRLSVHFTHYADDFPDFGYESASGSGNLSDRLYSDDNHGYDTDVDDSYVPPRWQPASRYVNFYSGIDNSNEEEDNSQTISLLRRGCPLQMIPSFHMTYSREEGIVARVPTFDPTMFLVDEDRDVEAMNRVLLGWNIEVDEEIDNYGYHFMQRMLSEMDDFPERWELRPRPGVSVLLGVYDAIRLVRLSEIEEYDSDLASYLEGVELDYDILAEIFVQCLPGRPDSWLSKDLAPLLLSNVSSSWRHLALNTPALWNHLFIDIVKPELDATYKAALAATWLSRSRSLPLRLRLRYIATWALNDEDTHKVADALLDAYFSCVSRWESVDLEFRVYHWPIAMPRLEPTPLLRSFRLFYACNLPMLFQSNSFQFASCPALTRLSLSCSPPSGPIIPWHQLTHLALIAAIPTIDILLLIQSCPMLTDFDVIVNDILEPADILITTHLLLSNLVIETHNKCEYLFARLALPSLTKLSLLVANSSARFHQELMSFLSRSRCKLDTLKLKYCNIDDAVMLTYLEHRSCASITSLNFSSFYNKPVFTDNVLKVLMGSPYGGEHVLLPNLESLKLTTCFGASPGVLGLMILSRCALWKEQRHLKQVELMYDQMDDQDYMLIQSAKTLGLYVSISSLGPSLFGEHAGSLEQ